VDIEASSLHPQYRYDTVWYAVHCSECCYVCAVSSSEGTFAAVNDPLCTLEQDFTRTWTFIHTRR